MWIAEHGSIAQALQHLAFDIQMAVHECFGNRQLVEGRERGDACVACEPYGECGRTCPDHVQAAVRRRHGKRLYGNVAARQPFVAAPDERNEMRVAGRWRGHGLWSGWVHKRFL